jgi:CRP/FNR family cyclic AMP-dependent transcriptional regulator
MYNIISEEAYPDGAIIMEEGSSGDWIYTILSGKVEIFKIINGRRVVIDMLEEGDIMGETSFLTQMKRTASARAIGEVTVGIIDRDYLDEEFNKLSGDFKTILLALAERLMKTTEAVCNFTDRYRDIRVPRDLKIVYKKNESFVKANLDNISSRGLFVRTNEPLEKGEEFLFKLEIPDTPDPIKGACEVIWSRTVSDSPGTRPKGMGCKFIKMSREDRVALKTFLANIQPEGQI